MSNKKAGNDFEQEFAEILAENGYWVHRLNPNKSGQPFDIIAVKNGFAEAIDCKVCDKDVFDFSRIEDNQHSAMKLWSNCGNGSGWFAVKWIDGSINMMSHYAITNRYPINRIHRSEAENHMYTLDEWLGR